MRPDPQNARRITLFAGHYGSGKTNVALNFARMLKRAGGRVVVADLDIVNPYFRTKDSTAQLAAEGIELVVSDYANSNVDFPALPKEIYAVVAPDEEAAGASRMRAVIDVGGDDRGALALGRYVDDIRARGDYAMLGVINASRPLTRTPADTVTVLREIEVAGQLPFTGLVNNTNLGPDTTVEDVLASRDYADEVARLMGVPVVFVSCRADLAPDLSAKMPGMPVLPIEIQALYYQTTL